MLSYRVESLEKQIDFAAADDSHRRVVDYYRPRNDEMECNMRFFRGEHYSDDELKAFKDTSRVPLVFNKVLAPVRTVTGTFLQAMFEPTFRPVEDGDQKMAEVLSELASFEASRLNNSLDHGALAALSYILARGYRRVWCDVSPGERPRHRAEILNPFGVYFDPHSTKLISRDDAEFVDIVHWMGFEEILRNFPEAEKFIDQSYCSNDRSSLPTDLSISVDHSKDRGHESVNKRNGMFKIIERFYRAWKTSWFMADGSGEIVEVKDVQKFKQAFPGARVFKKTRDFLHVAIWAPGLMSESKSFLYNGQYHSELRNPDTRRCMWPILEVVSSNILGESDSFVKALRDPIKMIDVLYTQLVEAAKHSGSGYETDPSAYLNKEEAARAKKYGAFSNQRYEMKPGMAGKGMRPIEGQTVSPANTQGMQIADSFVYEASAAPPALQGMSESATTAAALNAQRIEQASVQLAEFMANFREYEKQEMRVIYAGWREHYTDETVFRITGKDGNEKEVVLNQMVPAVDQWGEQTGEISLVNDIQAALYDVVIADSQSAPTYRDRVLRSISEILQNPAVAANPQIVGPLTNFWFRLSDAPLDLKKQIEQATAQAAQPQVPGSMGMDAGAVDQVMQSVQQVPMEA